MISHSTIEWRHAVPGHVAKDIWKRRNLNINSSHANIECGFVGLGSQGAPIAQRIIDAGYPMTLWARRPETLNPFRNSTAVLAPSLEALAGQVDYAGVCVTGDDAVQQVCKSLINHMQPESWLAIHSTVLPSTCEAIAKSAAAQGINLIDAPVSGGKPAAEAGMLTVMTGGDPNDLRAVRPVFETFASQIFHVGQIGAGQKAKLINNSLMAAIMGLTHSAVTAGAESGLDRESLLQLLSVSSARSFALDVYARIPESGNFGRAETLLEKVELLAEILGTDHPTSKALRQAASLMPKAQY